MKDTHGEFTENTSNWLTEEVLILIVMKDTHGGKEKFTQKIT